MEQEPISQTIPQTEKPKRNKKKLIVIGIIAFALITGGITTAILLLNQQNGSSKHTASLNFNSDNWSYDSDNNVYYQISVDYVQNVVSSDYQSFGIYVPGEYLDCTKNGDKYSCRIDNSTEINGYTASTAPIVMPVNTPGYSAQSAPSSYSYKTAASYLEKGIIYLYAGCRGRSSNMGAGGTQLSGMSDSGDSTGASNSGPSDGEKPSGTPPSGEAPSGDGAPSGEMPSGGPNNGSDNKSSDSSSSEIDFETSAPYGVADLKAAIRYVRYNSDLIPGDKNEIYAFGHSGGGAQSAILGASGDSELYKPYLEEMGAAMKYDDGTAISDAISGVNAWCPITELQIADAAYEWNMGQFSTSNTRADSTWTKALSNDLAKAFADYINNAGLENDGKTLKLETSSDGYYLSGSYYDYILSVIERSLNNYLADNYSDNSSRASYVASLGDWASYDSTTNKATVKNLAGFVNSQKSATKSVGAFDDLERGQAENEVFGDTDNNALHFDTIMSDLLNANDYSSYSGYDTNVATEYKNDITKTDSQGNDAAKRVSIYTPTDFILGKNTATPATHWRIRTGIMQGDTALTTEVNLALALNMNSNVKDVDFETVWAQGHTQAERSGNATMNFIEWIESLTK